VTSDTSNHAGKCSYLQKVLHMKRLLTLLAASLFTVAVYAQEDAAKGVVYGEVKENQPTISINDLDGNLKKDKYEGAVTGKVTEVCQAMGCWIKVEKADGSTVLVKAADHGFTMPKNIVGKEVMIDGKAERKEISEKQRKHYAEDAGKSEEEIAAIKGSSKEVTIQANGVKVLN